MTTTRGRGTLRQRLLVVSAALAVLASLVAVFAPAAWASIDISIPIDTIIHAPVGSETLLATAETGDLAGQECSVSADATNQSSIHPGNDLVVASGSSSVVLEDVEGVAGGTIHGEGVLTLGDTVTVTLVMGEDHTFSAGITVLIDCEEVLQTEVAVTANACDVNEQGAPVGSVDVEIAPDSGATVTVYSDAALENEVASFAGSGGSQDLSPGTYYWVAEAEPGYELTGEASGQFTIENCEGLVVVTSGNCLVGADGEEPGFVDVVIDPESAATVTVYDSSGTEVATFDASGSANLEPDDYTWEAVPASGFELVGEDSGSFTVEGCEQPPPPPDAVTDLVVTKIDLVDPVVVDSDNPTALITYEIVVTNNGPSIAEGVVVVDTLPASLTFVAASATAGTCAHASGAVTCDLGDLAVGGSVTITVVAETEPVGDVTDPTPVNVVVVSSSTEDSDASNNVDEEVTEIVEVLAVTVEPPTVLPFTGVDTGFLLATSIVMLGSGYAVIQVARRKEDG